MTKESDVTIILPNYNSELYIKKTLDSILNQTYQNWRLIIIDDNSNLNTKKILKKFKMNKKVKIFYLNSNRGAAYCRNYALKKIKTNYVAFIDSDDIWEKNKLKLQINFMKKKINMILPTHATKQSVIKKRKFFLQINLTTNNF